LFGGILELFDHRLENTEGFLARLGSLRFVGQHIETNRLGKRAALSDSYNISIFGTEGGGAVNSNVLVTLFETTVLGDVVQVVPPHNNGSLHLGGNDLSLQDTASNRDITCEGALFVNVVALNGACRSLNAQTNISHKAHGLLARIANSAFSSYKDGILLLIGLLELYATTDNGKTHALHLVRLHRRMLQSHSRLTLVDRYLRSHSTYSRANFGILMFTSDERTNYCFEAGC
jgi:hypothetical protein